MYHWGDTDDDIYGYSPYDGIICRESDEEIVDCPCCGLGPLIYYSLDICRCRNCGENIRVDDLTEQDLGPICQSLETEWTINRDKA